MPKLKNWNETFLVIFKHCVLNSKTEWAFIICKMTKKLLKYLLIVLWNGLKLCHFCTYISSLKSYSKSQISWFYLTKLTFLDIRNNKEQNGIERKTSNTNFVLSKIVLRYFFHTAFLYKAPSSQRKINHTKLGLQST